MRYIELTQGKVTMVDDRDYEFISQWNWQVNNFGYVKRSERGIMMHRVIMECPVGLFVDHIDGNKLNNQRSNLRICTKSENNCNRKAKSGFKGVGYQKSNNRWIAKIKKDKNFFYLGCFKTPVEAALAYDKKATELHGEFAKLNFGS